jgi:hypothetical protein
LLQKMNWDKHLGSKNVILGSQKNCLLAL